MWQIVLLFIILIPGVLFTIPPWGKKFLGGGNGKIVTAILHGIVFSAIAQFFIVKTYFFSPFSGKFPNST